MNITIRDAVLSDQPQINKLAYTLYYEHFHHRQEIFKNQPDAFSIGLLEKTIKDPNDHVIVAEGNDGSLLGYLYYTFSLVSESSLCYERKVTKVIELCTRKDMRRQGIARQLHNELVNRANDKGYKNLELDVWFFNKNAIAFYEQLGFTDKNKKMEFVIK